MHNNDKLIITNMRQQNKTDQEICEFLDITETELCELGGEPTQLAPITQQIGRIKRDSLNVISTPSITVKGEDAVLDTVRHMMQTGHNITIGE